MILNFEQMEDWELAYAGEVLQNFSITAPSWLPVTLAELSAEGDYEYDIFENTDKEFLYFSLIRPNEETIKKKKVASYFNIYEVFLTEIKEEKANRFRVFLQNRLQNDPRKLDIKKKI